MNQTASPQPIVTSEATQKASVMAGGGVLSFSPPDKLSMHQSYMPFLRNGGIYVPTPKKYDLGNEVFLMVRFPDNNERVPGVGTVVWINRAASVSKPSGIGVQFSDASENEILRSKIETFIAGIPAETPTFTM